jgi:hypothetical protein
MNVLQRLAWSGRPVSQGGVLPVEEGSAHGGVRPLVVPAGMGARLESEGEFLRSEVCRAEPDVFTTYEAWKAAMVEKGWA